MNKAFVKEVDNEEDEKLVSSQEDVSAQGRKNYMTPAGYARLQDELKLLIEKERPQGVDAVSWAASNGDRSENGDYIYGKKRLREIDRRVRFLTKRLEIAEVVDPSVHYGKEQVYFGATVTIMGIDEADPLKGQVSWISPVARSLIKASVGDEVQLATPAGMEVIEIVEVIYPAPLSL